MNRFQPPGRLSKVSGREFMIQIQTEFAWIPNPRITTQVILDGIVIHKIQKDWETMLETEEEQQTATHFLQRQHDQVVEVVKANQEFILSHRSGLQPQADFAKVLELDGVRRAFLLTSDGIITPFREEEIDLQLVQVLEKLFELIEYLDGSTRWGGLEEAYLVLEDDKLLMFRYQTSYLIVGLDGSVAASETARKVVDLLRAA